jgi:hypothetical protein
MAPLRKQASKSRTKTTEKTTSQYLIKNYGLLWKEEDVFWGKQRKPGTLLGRSAKSSTKIVDFRYQIGIYVLYADYKIVYIGQAGAGKDSNLFARLSQHRSNNLAGRWNQFSWFGLLSVLNNNVLSASKQNHNHDTKVVLDHFEAMLIHVIEPPLNRKGGTWGKSEQFLQHRDTDNIDSNDSEILREILDKINSINL